MYGLPKAGNGCPGSCNESVWEEGYRLFEAGYDNDGQAPNLSGIFLENESQLQFCMKSSPDVCQDCPYSDWPEGSYCMFRHEREACPPGFIPGSVSFDAVVRTDNNSNRVGGSVPAGNYTDNHTMLEFCCMESSISRSTDIVLPSNQGFYLMAAQNGICQSVRGMIATEESLLWSGISVNSITGTVPKGLSMGNNVLELAFCYYRPTGNINCEGSFERRDAYIAGVCVLCTILVIMTLTLVVSLGLYNIARKRTKQADIMTDRLNGEGYLSHKLD